MKRRRAFLAVVMILDLCLANACFLAGAVVTPAVAQQSEADVFVAQAILAYDAPEVRRGAGLPEGRPRAGPEERRGPLLHRAGPDGPAEDRAGGGGPGEGPGAGSAGPVHPVPAGRGLLRPRALRPGRDPADAGVQRAAPDRRHRLLRRPDPLPEEGLPGRAEGVPGRDLEEPEHPAARAVLLRADAGDPGAPGAGGGRGGRGPPAADRLRAHRSGRAHPRLAGLGAGFGAALPCRRPGGLPLRQQRGGGPAAQPRPDRGVASPAQARHHG